MDLISAEVLLPQAIDAAGFTVNARPLTWLTANPGNGSKRGPVQGYIEGRLRRRRRVVRKRSSSRHRTVISQRD
jgi:hypothetical protein